MRMRQNVVCDWQNDGCTHPIEMREKDGNYHIAHANESERDRNHRQYDYSITCSQ